MKLLGKFFCNLSGVRHSENAFEAAFEGNDRIFVFSKLATKTLLPQRRIFKFIVIYGLNFMDLKAEYPCLPSDYLQSGYPLFGSHLLRDSFLFGWEDMGNYLISQ